MAAGATACAAVQQIGLTLGGEAGARLAQFLGMCTSPDTMLHLIRAAPLPALGNVRVLGLDDWARRKGWRYMWTASPGAMRRSH